METTQIMYRKSIVGWFNVTLVETGAIYNVEPRRFIEITGVSSDAVVGCTEINGEQLVQLLTDRWTKTVTQSARKAVV